MPCGLFIVPTHLDALKTKGVLGMLKERDAGGYLSVVTFHPHAPRTRKIRYSPRHIIYEIGPDRFSKCGCHRKLRYLERVIYPIRLAASLLRIVHKHRVDFIRAQDPYWMGALGWLVSRATGIPLSISIHSDYDQRFKLDGAQGAPNILGSRSLAKSLESFLLKRAELILPIRQSLAEKAVDAGVNAERIFVIPHGLDFRKIHKLDGTNIRKKFDIAPNQKIVSFVGRLSMENYIDDVLETARRLQALRDDFVFVLAGGGSEENRIRSAIQSDVELSNVKMIGFQPAETIMELRRRSAVSICLMGGFSLVEALASGSPAVSYDIEWHSELVKDNETGFLAKEGDIEAVAGHIGYLLDHPKTGSRMGRAGQALALQRHSIRNTRKIKIKAYRKLIANPPRWSQKFRSSLALGLSRGKKEIR